MVITTKEWTFVFMPAPTALLEDQIAISLLEYVEGSYGEPGSVAEDEEGDESSANSG